MTTIAPRAPVRRTGALWPCLAALLIALLMLTAGVSPAAAGPRAPGYRINVIPEPTVFSANDNQRCSRFNQPAAPAGCDSFLVTITNSGSEPTAGPVTVTDTPPAGFTVDGVFGSGALCTVTPVQCTYPELAVDQVVVFRVFVEVPPTTQSVTNSVVVSGGGALVPTLANTQNMINTSSPAPGLSSFELAVDGFDGNPDTRAGDHPFAVTGTVQFASALMPDFANSRRRTGEEALDNTLVEPVQQVKDVAVDLPLGFLGNTQVADECDESELEAGNSGLPPCPPNSVLGMIQLDASGSLDSSADGQHAVSPIYNMVPEHGYPAEFGFNLLSHAVVLYATAVPTPQGYVLRVSSPGITRNVVNLTGASLSFWGVPAESSHDPYRITASTHEGAKSTLPPFAFLTNPVNCSATALTATAFSDTWQDPGSYLPDGSADPSDPAWRVASSVGYSQITGCDSLQFNPSLTLSPTTTQADEPAGLNVDLNVPQASQLPPNLTTPEVKNVSVTFPAGFSLSPSAADGLQACSDEQIGIGSALPGACPDASVLGSVEVTTPLLPAPLKGRLFLATPGCDPCSNADAADGNMFRLLIELQGSGVVLKLPGTTYVNTATGQITSTFLNNPQLPFSDFHLQLKSGLRAPLATPQSCGTFTATSDLTPWSSPITPDATPESLFSIDWDGHGGACPAGLPLTPQFSAGTQNANAGQYSPFTLTFAREDREQDLSGIQVHMPPGLLGTLSGVPLCGEPQASLGTCPQASRIGTMTVAAGAGPHPFYEQGSIYMTGPYAGAPFGLSVVVPTVAGPFNLGNVIVRAKINIDPASAALTVTSDPFPQILDGIPLRLRTSNVTIERPGGAPFILNPTNCSRQQITATIAGAQGTRAPVSAPFAVAGCAGLRFKPKFTVSTTGRTSKLNGASLDAKVSFPAGSLGSQSNIAYFKVALPRQLPSRLTTLQQACLAATFDANPAHCPPASVIGTVRATTPILPVALRGPVYFVSHGGAAFPDLVIVLQGYGVRVDLTGSTFISKAGVTSTTFKTIPDVPVSSFELYLPQGRYSALGANGKLCKSRLVMPTAIVAQDGAQIHQNTRISVTGCPRAKAEGGKVRAATRDAASRRGRFRR
jgi:hypothetical protein